MKTTVEIPDNLLREAKAYAARHGIPLREVMELGLRRVLHPSRHAAKPFRLKTVTTKGEGMVTEGDWPAIRAMIYEGRGG